ncbi:MAG: hypothetical protein AB1938_11655 [Myxococcota bacterium]
MEDFIFAPIVLIVGLGIHAAVLRQHSASEGRLLTLSFAMHLGAGFAQVLVTRYYFKGGDMMGYWETGVPMADALRSDFGTFFPALVEGFFRVEELSAPIEFMPGGGTTQSMSAVAIALLFVLGNSLYASVLLVAVLAYVSKVLIYRAIRNDFPEPLRPYVQAGATMLPTAVYWSCGLLKEPIVMAALGPMLLGLRWFAAGHRRVLALMMVVGGAIVAAVIKPYVLIALSAAAALFYFWSRLFGSGSAALKPFALVTALALGAGGFVLGNRYFIKSDNDSALKSLSHQRQAGYGVEGGSNYSLEGNPQEAAEIRERSLAYELALAPFALVTALFRPILFEARNAVQLANAIEATLLLILFLQIFRERRLGGILSAVRKSPALVFCAVFTLALALGTGLATTNMGTLSRYRAPMMPFFFVLLLVLRYERQASRSVPLRPALSPAAAAR